MSSRFIIDPKRASLANTAIVLLYAGAKREKCAALHKYNGNYLINHNINVIQKRDPSAEIIVVLGYEVDDVIFDITKKVRVVCNEHYNTTGPARSALLGIRATTKDNVHIVYGDVIMNDKYFSRESSHVVVNNECKTDVGIIADHNHVGHFAYGVEQKWGQSILLRGADVRKFVSNYGNGLLMHEILNVAIDDGLRLEMVTL